MSCTRCTTSSRSMEAGSEVHARHPALGAASSAHLHRHTYTAEQVIVAAHAYGSSKLLLHMQHKGRLTGLSSELGQRARTNSEQLLVMSRPYDSRMAARSGEDPVAPGSVAITSGVWPDAVTSIEPVYSAGWESSLCGFCSAITSMARRGTRPLAWLKELVEHPAEVMGIADPRRWSERAAIMLCMQTTDTSIELYWHDGFFEAGKLWHSSFDTHPGRRGVCRPARGQEIGQPAKGAAYRGHQPHRLRPLHRRDPDRRQPQRKRAVDPTSACSVSPAFTSWTAA